MTESVAMTKVSILGAGVVGTCVGRGLLQLDHEVKFYDISTARVDELRKVGLTATTSFENALDNSEVSFICVPTPTVSGAIELTHLQSVIKELANCLKGKVAYHLVVVKSTVVPTTTEKIIIPALEEHSRRKVGEQLGICVNPEFMTEIHESWTSDRSFARGFTDEPVIVVGESDEKSGTKLAQLYELLGRPIIRTNMVTAEMIKYAFNCALATRISYWNEIYYVCGLLGINSELVARVAGMDPRIGTYGTIHGKAFGGKCLPKDLRAFLKFVSDLGYDARLLKAVEEINERIGNERGVRE
ncbi:MAG: nucleotide sugar dehydrogenase [Candidatus Bathyarchaeia archaeon]